MKRDIHAPEIAAPMVSMLMGQIEDSFRRLSNLVRDMTPAELEYHGPGGNLNSTATLLAHLARTDLWWLYFLQDKEIPARLEDEYGSDDTHDGRLPVETGRTAAEWLDRHRRVLDLLQAYLQQLTDADLERELAMGQGTVGTVRWSLWHLAEHSALHQGHIRWLKAWARGRAK